MAKEQRRGGQVKRWLVEMTIGGSVRPVAVQADTRDGAKDAAKAKRPDATRIYGAYTAREWSGIVRACNATEVGK